MPVNGYPEVGLVSSPKVDPARLHAGKPNEKGLRIGSRFGRGSTRNLHTPETPQEQPARAQLRAKMLACLPDAPRGGRPVLKKLAATFAGASPK